MISVDDAIEVFVGGFTSAKSMFFPYAGERIGPIWVMRDIPRTTGEYRNEEYVSHNVPCSEVVQIAEQNTRGRFSICIIRAANDLDSDIRREMKAHGYRLQVTEPMFAHALNDLTPLSCEYQIERIWTAEQLDLVNDAAGQKQMTLEQLTTGNPTIRMYMALDSGVPVGWVRSVTTRLGAWCQGMYVLQEYRRRGIAKALMTRMLMDDKNNGCPYNVLLASHVGARLYPVIGYECIGELLLYKRVKRNRL